MKNKYKIFTPVLIITIMAVTLFITGCHVITGETAPTPSTQIIKDITAEEAYDLIQSNQDNPDFAIIDVRTPEEYAGGHLKNALNIDFQADNFREELDKLNKDGTYAIYCRSGIRAASARDTMQELGFREVYNFGGILDWEEAGLPIIR